MERSGKRSFRNEEVRFAWRSPLGKAHRSSVRFGRPCRFALPHFLPSCVQITRGSLHGGGGIARLVFGILGEFCGEVRRNCSWEGCTTSLVRTLGFLVQLGISRMDHRRCSRRLRPFGCRSEWVFFVCSMDVRDPFFWVGQDSFPVPEGHVIHPHGWHILPTRLGTRSSWCALVPCDTSRFHVLRNPSASGVQCAAAMDRLFALQA